MLLIADCGTSKCDWILSGKNGERHSFLSEGFNPQYHSTDVIKSFLQELLGNALLQQCKSVYFYGAGCSSDHLKGKVADAIRSFLLQADIHIEHDLLGAVRATTGDDRGIVCILGTGSNACYYDGETISRQTPALGFILGDEGGGSYFGKKFLADYFYNRVPETLAEAYRSRFGLSKDEVLKKVYRSDQPAVFLAGFTQLLGEFRDELYVRNLIYEGLSKFISIHVWCYEDFRKVPVHFAGSVAYYFKDILEEISNKHRFTVGKIERSPIEGLIAYHQNRS